MLTRVTKFFADFAPVELAEGWDNVGVLVENPRPNGSGIIGVTIDLTPAVLDELLVEQKAEVIIAYHPPIFSSLKKLRLADPKQNMILQTIAGGASIYSPHTCVDSCRNSINDWLVESAVDGKRELVSALKPITPNDSFNAKQAGGGGASPTSKATDAEESTTTTSSVFDTVPVGAGRIATLTAEANLSIESIVTNLKKHLKVPTARVSLPFGWTKDTIITSVAVCAGSGGGLFKEMKGPDAKTVQLLISGEMGHHDVLAANDKGQAVVLFEHTNSERGYLKAKLVPLLQKELSGEGEKEAKIVVSQRDRDPLVVW